ncbi:unnamed protein product [Medioppia subpectinata]|uniref:Uncharacterized protein n=1 Tax=Medioppia subpectinata TaxID=1979941 RepID=A0A7R9LWC0_9ACAR|nr:unnamed protein product [Medioppia subpectinata]CAG2121659.1 unnamed protein product [Medioppia subpectinata]
MYEILSDVLDDKELVAKFDKCLTYEILASIADIKYINEEMFVRFNCQKTMDWLSKKIDNTVNAMIVNGMNVSCDGSKVSGYKSGKEDANREKG